jgi:hypothetical protein
MPTQQISRISHIHQRHAQPGEEADLPLAGGTPRQWPRVLVLRDVRDVEAYVARTLSSLQVHVTTEEAARLVRAGVKDAWRIERAMPPDRRLLPVLEDVLPQRLSQLAGQREPLLRAG